MVEQIQVTPPPTYEALNTPHAATTAAAAATDPKTGTSHNGIPSVPPAKESDTVTLSASAQASRLYLAGRSVTEISALLGLPPATVDSDLNISQTSSTDGSAIQPTTAQSSGTQVTQADAATPATASSSPYTAPVQTAGKI
jgi:hypothetical protein